jgi:hypothetical protein
MDPIFDNDSLLLEIADDSDRFQAFLRDFSEMIETAEREKGVRVIYDSVNINEFIEELGGLNDDYISPQYGLNALLSNAEDIREKFGQSPYGYYLWNFNAVIPISDSISILAQIAEEIFQDKAGKAKELAELTQNFLNEGMKIENQGKLARTAEDVLQEGSRHVLIHKDKIRSNRPVIPVIRDSYGDECPCAICIQHVENPDALECWIKKNRQPRKFHPHKHGEYGKGAEANKGEEVSRLLCGEEHAQALLNTAIGDQRVTKRLLNFDEEYKKYIVFEQSEADDKGLENTYHGYHLEDENKIRTKDRDLLKLLKSKMAKDRFSE